MAGKDDKKKKKQSFDITNTDIKTGKPKQKGKNMSASKPDKPTQADVSETEQYAKPNQGEGDTSILGKRDLKLREFITGLKQRTKAAGI